MPGTEPDEEIFEILLRSTTQEGANFIKRGITSGVSGLAGGLLGTISGTSASADTVVFECTREVYNLISPICTEAGIDIRFLVGNSEGRVRFSVPVDQAEACDRLLQEYAKTALEQDGYSIEVEKVEPSAFSQDSPEVVQLGEELAEEGVSLEFFVDEEGFANFKLAGESYEQVVSALKKSAGLENIAEADRPALPQSVTPSTFAMISERAGALGGLTIDTIVTEKDYTAPAEIEHGEQVTEKKSMRDRLSDIFAARGQTKEKAREEGSWDEGYLSGFELEEDFEVGFEVKYHELDNYITVLNSLAEDENTPQLIRNEVEGLKANAITTKKGMMRKESLRKVLARVEEASEANDRTRDAISKDRNRKQEWVR